VKEGTAGRSARPRDAAGAAAPSRDADPFELFADWFEAAARAGLPEPEAMTLATATADGAPSARVVLLKAFDRRGFVFFTNYESRKGRELHDNPRAAVVLYWQPIGRQIRIEGTVELASQEESSAYFDTRSTESRLGAWASAQSAVVDSRETLERAVERVRSEHEGSPPPCPPFWGGIRLVPSSMEFWVADPYRLHDRWRYTRTGGRWVADRLSP
jgi:pyridoxamine 5'-phosphate oxidase